MRIFRISMPDSRKRRLSGIGKARLTGVPFEIVDGVEAHKMRPESLEVGPNPWRSLTPGQIGCYTAHLRALQRIVDYDLPWAFVAEDDFCLEAAPDYGFAEIGNVLPPGFRFIHLQRDLGLNPQYRVLDVRGPFFLVREPPLCTAAYIISREFAMQVLREEPRCRMPIDHLYCHMSHQGDFYHVVKPLVGIQLGLDSDTW